MPTHTEYYNPLKVTTLLEYIEIGSTLALKDNLPYAIVLYADRDYTVVSV